MEDGPQFIVAIALVFLLAWGTIWMAFGGANFLLNEAANKINEIEIPVLQTASDKAEEAITWPWRAGSNYIHYHNLTGTPIIKDDQRNLSYLSARASLTQPPWDPSSQWLVCQVYITNADTSAHAIKGYLEVEASYAGRTWSRNVELSNDGAYHAWDTESESRIADLPILDIPPGYSLHVNQKLVGFDGNYQDQTEFTKFLEAVSVRVDSIVLTIHHEYIEIHASERVTKKFDASGCNYPRK